MKTHREWLEPTRESVDSYVRVTLWDGGDAILKLSDCDRSVSLGFNDSATGWSKIAKLRKALDRIEAHMEGATTWVDPSTEVEQPG